MVLFAIYLASQQSDECIESVLLDLVIKIPNSLDDGVSGHHPSRSPHQQLQ
jgi:hypothetical protein